MFGITRWRKATRTLSLSLVLAMTVSLWGCGGQSVPAEVPPEAIVIKPKPEPTKLLGKIAEVSPPEVIQQLRTLLDEYQPQVSIVSPRLDEVLKDNTVSVKFQVKDLPIFKDEKLGLGPHLHVFLDNQPYQAVYDISQPLVLKDLEAGTHTLRVFASRPWHESFKNDGAYAQTTFHVFTKTPSQNPEPEQPLLTYSRPQGSYGAEPIMLDFFLTNAPLHFVAQEDDQDEMADWRIRVTVNGSSFVIDRWQPIYLKGFNPGKNWIQLEYIDENGNLVQNVYNNTARIFTYEPGGTDTLSRLVRGELSFEAARGIVDRTYKYESPQPVEAPAPSPVPEVTPVPVVPIPAEQAPEIEVSPEPEKEEEVPKPAPTEVPSQPKGGFFNRFRRGEPPQPAPSEEPAPVETSEPEEIPAVPAPTAEEPPQPEEKEAPEPAPTEVLSQPKGGFFNRFRRGGTPEPTPSAVPAPVETPEPEETPAIPAPTGEETPESDETKVPEVVPPTQATPKGGFFNRFRRPEASPQATPSLEPSPSPVLTVPEEEKPEAEKPEEQPKSAPSAGEPKENFFDRFRRAVPKPSPSVAPTPIEEPQEEASQEIESSETETLKPTAPSAEDTTSAPKEDLFDRENVFNRFRRGLPQPVSPETPVAPEAPVLEEPQESAPAAKEAEPSTPSESPLDRLRQFLPKPSPSVTPRVVDEPTEPTEPTREEIKEPEATPSPEEVIPSSEATAPAAQESPLDRFRRFLPKVSPSPEPAPIEEPVVPPEPLETEPPTADKLAVPKENQFDRFRRPPVKPSPSVTPTPVPEVLESPTEQQEVEAIEPKSPEAAPTPAPQNNFLERFRRPAPSLQPSVEPPPAVSKPSQESQPVEQPEAADGRSELEKRLGIPITPATPQPLPPKPQPKSYSTEFQRPTAIPTPESSPVKLPETLEAPTSEPTPIETTQ